MFIIWLCFVFFIQKGNCLNLDVVPNHIEPGKTETLLVNCSLNGQKIHNLAFLQSLILARSVDMNISDYEVVASISTIDGLVNVYDRYGVGSGIISYKRESYLCVQWAYPISEMGGRYLCEANGMSLSWKPLTISVSAEISSSEISQSTIVQLLRSTKLENIQVTEDMKKLTERNKVIEKNVTLSTDYIKSLQEKDKFSIQTLFYESSLYNGHRYHLAKESALVSPTLARVTCTQYGGYVAEIDDEEELNFVRNFVKNYPSYESVLISGSDEGHEGYWTNLRNNTALKFFNWSSGEPNNGNVENCLTLWKKFDWHMADNRCIVYNSVDLNQPFLSKSYATYLCEDFAI